MLLLLTLTHSLSVWVSLSSAMANDAATAATAVDAGATSSSFGSSSPCNRPLALGLMHGITVLRSIATVKARIAPAEQVEF